MQKFIVIILLFLVSTSLAFSQKNQESESQKLNQQVFALFQQGKFEEAILLAEKIVESERNSQSRNLQNLGTAIINLALLKKEHYWVLRKDLANPNMSKEDSFRSTDKRLEYTKSIETLLQEAIDIYEQKLKIETQQLASAKFELAMFFNRFAGENVGTKPFRAEEIEKLYTQALLIREKMLGANDEQTIFTMISLANFYQSSAEFEKSLPLYERFIQTVEKKYGGNSEFLLSALRPYTSILVATEQADEANEIIKRISAITGQTERLSEANIDLSPRNVEDRLSKLIEDPKTISNYKKKQKWLKVNVLIDEKGRIIELKAENPQEKDMFGKSVDEKANKEIRDWKFRPFVYGKLSRKMRGIVWYPYFVKA